MTKELLLMDERHPNWGLVENSLVSDWLKVDASVVVIVGFVNAPNYNLHIAVHFVVVDVAIDLNPDLDDIARD